MSDVSNATRPQHEIELAIGEQKLILRGDGTALISSQRQLLVADLHLGKDASFRACGIPVPAGINESTLRSLDAAIESTDAGSVFVLGDLIHNRDSMSDELIEQFAAWRSKHANVTVNLIRGNHDRHVAKFPDSWNLRISETETIDKLLLCHETDSLELPESETAGRIQIGGHLHPVASVGRGADSFRLPCFVIDQHRIILPAFGAFKGGLKQQRRPSRRLFAIAESMIWQV